LNGGIRPVKRLQANQTLTRFTARLRLSYLYLAIALVLLGLGSWLYIVEQDVIDAGNPAKALSESMAPRDLTDFDPEADVGPHGAVAMMVQVNDSYIMELGPLGPDGETLFAYPLFSVKDDRSADTVEAAVITANRGEYEEELGNQVIGTAMMGPLYNIYAYQFYDRAVSAAVIGALSELGLSSGRNFIMLRPSIEMEIPATYVNPSKSELVLPVLLMLGAGLFTIFGLHTRALQRRGKDKPDVLDDVLKIDDDDDEGSILRKRA